MSARRPSSTSKKQRLSTAAAPSTLPLPPPTLPAFSSSGPPATHTCYAAPPILFFPKPAAVPLPPRPASSRPSRSSPLTARSTASSFSPPSSSARPATARPADTVSERNTLKAAQFSVSEFHVPVTYRPSSPRADQHSAWTTATSPLHSHSSTSCTTSPHSQSNASEGEEVDADSCSVVESLISPFFLPQHPTNNSRTSYRTTAHHCSTTHSSYRTVATLPSHERYTHRHRFLRDNAYQRSFNHIIGGSGTTGHYDCTSGVYEQTRRMYDESGVGGECRSHLPGGSGHLLGKWKPDTRNGNELFANIVQHSKFHQPTFV